MSELVPFFYGDFEIRTVVIKGDGWLVAPDVAKLLELRDTNSALRMVDSEDKMTLRRSEGPHFPRGMDARVHEVTVVNESGFYAMVFQSKKPEAKRVRRWVTGTVLPEIRRTGSYQPRPEIDLEDTDVALDKIIELASIAKGERARANKAEARLEVEQRQRHAIEGGDGIDPTTFGKKYFGDVPARQFDKHLYEHDYLIDQRKTRRSSNGEMKDGYDHRKPTANGRKYFYPHDGGTHGGRRRFNPRVRPQMEIALRDALIAEGLPANTHSTGLVLISNKEMQELGA